MSTVACAAAWKPGDESLCELEGRQSSASSLLRLRLLPGVGSETVSDEAERGVLPTTMVVALGSLERELPSNHRARGQNTLAARNL